MADQMDRRALLSGLGWAGLALGSMTLSPSLGCSRSPTRTKVRVGYLHTLAVDAQLWLADHTGAWAKQGLDGEFIEFTTGVDLFKALHEKRIDVLATGAAISNFPAGGEGKVFLINNIEWATAQLWVHPEHGIKTVQDLKGKKITTTRGTTAHVFLHRALKSAGLDSTKDVEIVDRRMSEAVTLFISGAVPALALWVPFNLRVREKVVGAKMLVDQSAYYPEAAIVGGWAARNDFFQDNKRVLKEIIRAWAPANDFLVDKPDEAVSVLQTKYYSNVPIEDLREQYDAGKLNTAARWSSLYRDGTVARWLDQITQMHVELGSIKNPIRAEQYFDPSLYLEVLDGSP